MLACARLDRRTRSCLIANIYSCKGLRHSKAKNAAGDTKAFPRHWHWPTGFNRVECPAESALDHRLNRLYHYLATYGSDDAARGASGTSELSQIYSVKRLRPEGRTPKQTAAATAGCMYVHSKRVWIRWSLAVAQPCISTSMYVSALPFRLSII